MGALIVLVLHKALQIIMPPICKQSPAYVAVTTN